MFHPFPQPPDLPRRSQEDFVCSPSDIEYILYEFTIG